MGARLQIKRGSSAQWAAANTVLFDGQMGVDKDTGEIKLGDGITPWADLPIILESQYVPLVGGKAPDSNKLNGQDASFYMPASKESDFMSAIQSASFLPVGGKAADSDKLDGLDSTSFVTTTTAFDVTSLLSPNRQLTAYRGSGNVFPVAANGLVVGDTFFRIDIGTTGSMWVYVGGFGGTSGFNGWVHKGPIVCTSTTRPSIVYNGMQIYETDTARDMYYSALDLKWRNAALSFNQQQNGINSVFTGAEFQMGMWKGFGNAANAMLVQITFPVAFAAAPVFVFANPYGFRAGPAGYSPASTTNWEGWTAVAGETTTTQMNVRLKRTDGQTFGTSTDYYFNWMAIGQK